MLFLRLFVFIAVAHQLGDGSPVVGLAGPRSLMQYRLFGINPGRSSPKDQRNLFHNMLLQQIVTGSEESLDNMELLTKIALHDAKNNEIFYENLPNRFSISREHEAKPSDNIMKMNFTQVVDPDATEDSLGGGNPLVVLNVHLEYLTNGIDESDGRRVAGASYPYLGTQEIKDKIFHENINNFKQLLDFQKRQIFFNLKETTNESNEDKMKNYKAPADELPNLIGNFQKSYSLADLQLDKGKPQESITIKPKRGFSLLTRWRPFSKLGQDSLLRRPYFQAVLRHGDNTLTAQASSLSRPYGTPLRWG